MNLSESLFATPLHERVALATTLQHVLEEANQSELTLVGKLLCHASSPAMREEYPIIGDITRNMFDLEIFGDPDEPDQKGTYVTMDSYEDPNPNYD